MRTDGESTTDREALELFRLLDIDTPEKRDRLRRLPELAGPAPPRPAPPVFRTTDNTRTAEPDGNGYLPPFPWRSPVT